MINKAMFKQVQAFRRQGFSQGAIGRALEIDPRTVSKYFAMGEEDYRAYRQDHLFRDKAFDDRKSEILEVYGANDFRTLPVSSVYDYLEERYGSLPGNEQTLRNYIAYLLQTESLRLDDAVRLYSKVPELPFGKQMQLDFGQYRCRSGLVLYIFAAVLSASRYKYVIFQRQPFRTLDVIRHLLDCFDYFGGRPEELVIDQDRLMVVSENAGDIIYTKDFKYFIDEQEFRLYVCRGADPETKGKIESLVKFVKGNFLASRDFERVEEANAGVLNWLPRRANGKISQATKQIPAVLIDQERAHLRPLRNSIFRKDSLLGREERTANDKALISVQACNYQLPPQVQEQDGRNLHDRGGAVRLRRLHREGDHRLQALSHPGTARLHPELPERRRDDRRGTQGCRDRTLRARAVEAFRRTELQDLPEICAGPVSGSQEVFRRKGGRSGDPGAGPSLLSRKRHAELYQPQRYVCPFRAGKPAA